MDSSEDTSLFDTFLRFPGVLPLPLLSEQKQIRLHMVSRAMWQAPLGTWVLLYALGPSPAPLLCLSTQITELRQKLADAQKQVTDLEAEREQKQRDFDRKLLLAKSKIEMEEASMTPGPAGSALRVLSSPSAGSSVE